MEAALGKEAGAGLLGGSSGQDSHSLRAFAPLPPKLTCPRPSATLDPVLPSLP